ncbi:MAG TPA: hypothetical protein VNL18_15490 [Gemmatimonadales bacterium]|nr:hypothetical protein [Gemmatimonadales bacterium]
MAFDILVRALFSDQGLSVGLAKANAALNQIGRSSPQARAGLRAVEQGARMLAFQAAGLSGGLGQVARGLLLLGGGSALVLGAVAGIGLISAAYKFFRRDAEAAKKAEKEFREELHRTAEAERQRQTPRSLQIGRTAERAREEFEALTRQIEERRAALRRALTPSAVPDRQARLLGAAGAGLTPEQIEETIARDAKLNALYRERRQIGIELTLNRQAATRAAEEETRELREALRVERERIMLGRAAFRRGELPAFPLVATVTQAPISPERQRAAEVEAGVFLPDLRVPPMRALERRAREAEEALAVRRGAIIEEMQRPEGGFGSAQAMALMNAVLLARGGGLGGALQGAGGLLATLQGVNPLIGAGVSLLGTLIGGGRRERQIIDVRVEEFGPRADEQLKRTRGDPDQFRIQVVLPDGRIVAEYAAEDILYRTSRLTAQDARPRGRQR